MKGIASILLWMMVVWLPATLTGQNTNSTPDKKGGTNDYYRLAVGDALEVKVYREADLNSGVTVDPDGMIHLQILGPVKVSGLTMQEATKKVRELYASDYLVNPYVVLDLVATNKPILSASAKDIYIVLGQVGRPGTYEMKEGEAVNLLQAIAMAGGYTRMGAPSKISLTRIENGVPQVIKLDADAMVRKKEKPFEIKPDDIITVGEKIF